MTSFGGPPVHIDKMRADLVEQRGWISAQQFNMDLAAAGLLPGPFSTKLVMYIGLRLHGTLGAVLSGACFILPAFLIVLAISLVYVHLGTQMSIEQWLYGVKPVTFALIAAGTVRIGRSTVSGWREWLLLGACLMALLFSRVSTPALMVLGGGGMVALTRARTGWSLAVAALFALAQAQALQVLSPPLLLWEFFKIGAVVHGGGLALAGILHEELVVARGWLTQEQLLYALAIGQGTPGPLFITATFIGYLLSGLLGAVMATAGIFAPGFMFVLLEHHVLGAIRQHVLTRTFLRGVSVAITATLIASVARLARPALPDALSIAIAAASAVLLLRFKVGGHWLVAVGLAISTIRFSVFGTL